MKFIAVTAALILAPLATHAADLDLRKSYPPEAPAPAKATWTGAYAGVNGGWGWGTVTDRYVTPVLGDIKTKGALGGFQVGYNHQVGNVVLGAEADFDLGRVHGQISTSLNDVTVGQYRVSGAGRASSSLSSFGTIRLRSGYTLGPALLYVTGGYA